MSIITPWIDDIFYYHPSRADRRLGLWKDAEDYLQNYVPRNLLYPYPLEEQLNISKSGLQDVGASDKHKFRANLDVQQFYPEEISVKVTGDNTVTVEGRHEEKPDEHGYISRHFVRKYVLPDNFDIKRVRSKLSSDGVLTITAPKIDEEKQVEYREIPIARTGQPVKKIEQKTAEEPKK